MSESGVREGVEEEGGVDMIKRRRKIDVREGGREKERKEESKMEIREGKRKGKEWNVRVKNNSFDLFI